MQRILKIGLMTNINVINPIFNGTKKGDSAFLYTYLVSMKRIDYIYYKRITSSVSTSKK